MWTLFWFLWFLILHNFQFLEVWLIFLRLNYLGWIKSHIEILSLSLLNFLISENRSLTLLVPKVHLVSQIDFLVKQIDLVFRNLRLRNFWFGIFDSFFLLKMVLKFLKNLVSPCFFWVHRSFNVELNALIPYGWLEPTLFQKIFIIH